MTKLFHLAFAAGLGAAVAGSLAFAPLAGEPAKTEDRAVTVLARADMEPPRGPEAGPRPERAGPFGPHGRHAGPPPGPRFGPPLSARLAAQETEIGIRSGQLDAWRDYADALQAMLAPPTRPETKPAPDARPADAFGFEQAMAEDAARRGEAAGRLKAAIETLKAKLSPEQIERAARAMGPLAFGPSEFGPDGIPGPKAPPPPPGKPAPGPDRMERGAAQPG